MTQVAERAVAECASCREYLLHSAFITAIQTLGGAIALQRL